MPDNFLPIWQTITDGWIKIWPVLLQILEDWWWVPALLVFFNLFKQLYFYYISEKWDASMANILLEIKVPKDVERPIRVMEHVFANLWSIFDPPNWKEKWIEGHFLLSFSFEIAGIDGVPHFYIRTREIFRKLVESSIYAQYPEAEISKVEDYTKNVPQDIPNKEWDLFGTSFKFGRSEVYPIKTYTKFFEEKVETKEEKRLDPLSSLMDGIASLGPGEQVWVQIVAKPITISGSDKSKDLEEEGKKLVDKLVKRPEKKSQKPILQEAAETMIFGSQKKEEKPERLTSPEIDLTPGEKEAVRAIEEKIAKVMYDCTVRFIYLGKRDVFLKPLVRIPFSFFNSMATVNLNAFRVEKPTLTKVTYFFKKRRVYLKQRRLFRYYQKRLPPYFPLPGGTIALNIEELATMWHLPSKSAAPGPTLLRVQAKKGEPPAGLPVEE